MFAKLSSSLWCTNTNNLWKTTNETQVCDIFNFMCQVKLKPQTECSRETHFHGGPNSGGLSLCKTQQAVGTHMHLTTRPLIFNKPDMFSLAWMRQVVGSQIHCPTRSSRFCNKWIRISC